MTTVNYDQAVAYYDETRAFQPGVAERYRWAVRPYLAGHDKPRILELAIGTGLIGASFLAAGDSYVGVDISRGMMGQIAPKLGNGMRADLAQVDIARDLPFADDSFDLVQAVRVFHLLDDWQRCIQEVRRVLKPGGHLLIVRNAAKESEAQPPWAIVHEKWDEILASLGVGNDGETSRDIPHGRDDDGIPSLDRRYRAASRSIAIHGARGILSRDGRASPAEDVQQRLAPAG